VISLFASNRGGALNFDHLSGRANLLTATNADHVE
jgi:hypothetical protein